jgi:hypothetical protein
MHSNPDLTQRGFDARSIVGVNQQLVSMSAAASAVCMLHGVCDSSVYTHVSHMHVPSVAGPSVSSGCGKLPHCSALVVVEQTPVNDVGQLPLERPQGLLSVLRSSSLR